MPFRQDKYRRMQDGELIAAVKGGDSSSYSGFRTMVLLGRYESDAQE